MRKESLTVIKEPTQTNVADGFTKALQTAKYLEWRNRPSIRYDGGDKVESSKREALAETGRWARVKALHAVPRSVLIATLMQQEFTPRQHRLASAHPAQAVWSEGGVLTLYMLRPSVDYLLTLRRPLPDFLQTSCLCVIS